MKKLLLLTVTLLLCGCIQSTEQYIKETSIAFAESLHEYSFENEKWSSQVYSRLDELQKSTDEPVLAYDMDEIYPEYTDAIKKEYSKIMTEEGLEKLIKHLTYNRMHPEKENVEYNSINEYESSYSVTLYLTSSHMKLLVDISWIKTDSKPLITGFKTTVLEYSEPYK